MVSQKIRVHRLFVHKLTFLQIQDAVFRRVFITEAEAKQGSQVQRKEKAEN